MVHRHECSSSEMFAYVLDQPAQREALQEEILERIAAIQALSQTMATAQLESPDPRTVSTILKSAECHRR